MADGDFDLDAMLDSALDEEFDAPATGAEAGGESDGELDLDAMLDEAMVSAALDGEAAREQKQGINAASERVSAARASSDFGPSQQWLQRKQGGGETPGGGAGRGKAVEAFSFLRAERREAWKAALAEDGLRQADADKQRPLSRAYRSFYSAGKEEGGIVVHLGSGAAAPAAAAAAAAAGSSAPGVSTDGGGGALQGRNAGVAGGAGAGGDAEEGSAGAANMFEDVLGKAVAKSGTKEPPLVGEADNQPLDRLKASYLRLVAKDVRARVSKDPDASANRFPGIASKILA
ncbi:unnamed protein product [Laminaria digitata]